MDKPVTVKLRVSLSLSVSDVLKRISEIPGVVKTVFVFPHTAKPRLIGYHVLTVESSAVEQVLLKLRQDPDVELAYETPARSY